MLFVMLMEYLSSCSVPPLSDGGLQLIVAENGLTSSNVIICGTVGGAMKFSRNTKLQRIIMRN